MSGGGGSSVSSASISHELDANVKLAFKSLGDTTVTAMSATTYDVRCAIGIYLAQLIFYAISQLQLQQLHLQQQIQMANAAAAVSSAATQSNGLSLSCLHLYFIRFISF